MSLSFVACFLPSRICCVCNEYCVLYSVFFFSGSVFLHCVMRFCVISHLIVWLRCLQLGVPLALGGVCVLPTRLDPPPPTVSGASSDPGLSPDRGGDVSLCCGFCSVVFIVSLISSSILGFFVPFEFVLCVYFSVYFPALLVFALYCF